MNSKFTFLISLSIVACFTYRGGGQILFENAGFESDLYCDPADCEETDVDCIEGWWNYASPSDLDEVGWIYYDDYFLCDVNDISISSCGDDRGIRMFWGTGSEGFLFPTTNNPFLGANPLGAYEINFQLNIIDKNSNQGIVEVWVDDYENKQTPSTDILIGSIDGMTLEDHCYDLKIGITDPEKVMTLVTHPYLIFKISGSGGGPSPPVELSIDAVLDNPSACVLLDLNISRFKCDQICLTYTSECATECNEDREYDVELDDCFIQTVWYEDEEYTEEITECLDPFIGEGGCCFTPSEPGTYYLVIALQFQINGETVVENHFLEVEHEPCTTAVISTTTTWNSSHISESTRFQTITVESGDTLIIEEDLTVQFCEDGKLIINPGGTVILDGTLTASCSNGWEGVEVQGNGTTNQYHVSGVFPQGRIYCNPDSKIEFAHTAVRLFGPDYEDAGGLIYAEGAFFINNSRGLDFAPYNNFFPTADKQKPYASRIRNCTFNLDEHYLDEWPFTHHIRMESVFGIGIYGTYFGNDQIFENILTPKEYGVGVMAVNSNFSIGGSTLPVQPEPCFPDCSVKSTFYGLGIGVSAGRTMRNRPFQVYNAEFSNCFFGIVNEGVSGVDILFNEFYMGEIKELKFDENQVGISMAGYQHIGAIQENHFVHEEGNADYTLGIVCNYLGEVNNPIRRNTFEGLHVGNQAFYLNGDEDRRDAVGLLYLCNQNHDVIDKDFYVRDTPLEDHINYWHGLNIGGISRATGNTFSGTGDPDDGYFANYGDSEIDYHYYEPDPDQVPDEDAIIGVTSIAAPEGECDPEHCLHPCIGVEDLDNVADDFYSNLSKYEDALALEEYLLASYYRIEMDSNLNHILRYMEYDTTDFDRDSLRKWYGRSGSIAGDLILAGDYFDSGLYTLAQQTIDSIITQHSLNTDQLFDMNRAKTLYSILSSRSVYTLTTADIDTMMLYSEGSGASYSLSRSILSLLDTFFTPRYYIPGEINPREAKGTIQREESIKNIQVYPNPANDILMIEINHDNAKNIKMDIYDIAGRLCYVSPLESGFNSINLRESAYSQSGTFLYRITSNEGILAQGKLIIIQ